MATYHKYVARDGHYIKHTFRSEDRLIHVTLQVTAEAEAILKKEGIGDGRRIPGPVLHDLESRGLIYTNQSGGGESDPVDSSSKLAALFGLTDAARSWALTRLECHPEVVVTVEHGRTDDGRKQVEITYANIPERFVDQLVRVAKSFDGADFLKELDRSYSTAKSQSTLKHIQRV